MNREQKVSAVQRRMQDYIDGVVAKAPPLSAAQRDRLAMLLRPSGGEPTLRSLIGTSPAPAPRIPPKTKIYRHYDRCGCLLYIGISFDPIKRAYAHGGNSWWTRWATRMETSDAEFQDRAEALETEKRLIYTERPVFNTTHAANKRESIVRYFVDHELWDYLSVAGVVTADEKPELIRTLLRVGMLEGVQWHEESLR